MVEDAAPKTVWQALNDDPQARLVDVRTEAEWRNGGVPDLSAAGKEVVLIPWQFGPDHINPDFVEGLAEAGLAPEHTVYFICRSGIRSAAAAEAARAAGYASVYNVANGFEGGRPFSGAWKPKGLPWRALT